MVPIPAKRHRSANALEDDEDDLRVGSSSARRDSRKRQRLSTVDSIFDDEEDDLVLSDDEQNGIDDILAHGDCSLLDDVMVDAETGELDVDALLGNEAARFAGLKRLIEKRRKNATINYAAENAIIEEVRCINFMCHSHLTVTLGPLINFVIGHNGSGKSAVLTALTLCLGGKASSTNRGGSLKSFIKEGQDAAVLAVKIKNQGTAAFRPELYGKTIIVERHFNRAGASGFKIKNANEKVISTKRSDLEDIIDAFQLQVDNPMNVLSQDMARQFLNHSTPTDKFTFFLTGTQIAALDRDYLLLEQNMNETEAKLALKRQDKEILRQRKKEAIRKSRVAQRHEYMREKMLKYRIMYAWKQVEDEEAALEVVNNHIANAEAEIEQKTAEADAASTSYDQAGGQVEEAERLVQECQAALEPIRDKKRDLEAAFSNGKENLTKTMAEQRDIKSALTGDKNVIDNIKRNMDEERRRQEDAHGGDHGRRLQEIQDAKAIAEEKRVEFETHNANSGNLDRQRAEAEDQLKQFEPVLQQKRNEVRQQQHMIEEIRRNQGKWMSGFDSQLPALLRAIENETRFRQRPVGPVGRHIRLLKPEWSHVLEKQAGAQLNAFVVTSKHDEGILRELMRRTNYPRDRNNNTPVLIGNPTPIDTSRHEPAPHLLTWMRALQFDNDLVRNQLIINNLIEQTVLIEDYDEAFAFAYPDDGSGGNRQRPPNVKQVFTMSKDKRDGIRFGWASSGAGMQSPIQIRPRRPRMQTEIESQINVATSTLDQYKLDLQQAENDHREKQTAVTRARQAVERHRRQVKDLQIESQRAQEQVDEMQDALEAETPTDGRLEDLQRQLKEAEAAMETHVNMLDEASTARNKINESQREIRAKMQEVDMEMADGNEKISKAEARLNKVAERRDKALRAKNSALDAVEEAREQLASYQRDRQEQQERVENHTAEAQHIGDRVPVPPTETAEGLEAKYNKMGAHLVQQARELGGTQDELQAAACEAIARYKEAERQENDMDKAHYVMKQTLNNRKARLAIFRRTIADRSRIMFTYLLAARKFRGTLIVNHGEKTLDLSVEPDITKVGAEGRQTRTLSGGEKSFSTVCLLLSLWDAMGAPTRCLDEFDVFMDNVNREISMKMIIEACRDSVSKQFLFITPQAMGNVSLGQDVKIIKMSDPERGQTTLPY